MQESNEATLCYYGSNEKIVSVVATIHRGSIVIEQKKFMVDDYADFAELSDVIFEYTAQHNVRDLYSMSEALPLNIETQIN